MSKDKTLTFKTYHVNPLGTWLQKLELPGKKSRSRNRFIIDFISKKSEEIEKERVTLLTKYSEKDKDGKPKMKTVPDGSTSDTFEINKENMKKFNVDYNEFMKEDYVIDVTKAKETDVSAIAEIVLNTEEKFVDHVGDMAATMYNEWCEIFEKL